VGFQKLGSESLEKCRKEPKSVKVHRWKGGEWDKRRVGKEGGKEARGESLGGRSEREGKEGA